MTIIPSSALMRAEACFCLISVLSCRLLADKPGYFTVSKES
jgi:hypothetical protein